MNDSHPLDYYPDEETGDERADSLALIDKARAFLAQAETLADIGHVREIAERARRYASAAKMGRAAENHAARLRLEAERKAGQLLDEMDRHRPGDGRPKLSDGPTLTKPTLPELGVSRQQATDWRRMASVPDEVFESHVDEVQKRGEPLTTSGVVQVARAIEKAQRAAEPKPKIEPATVPARIEVADAQDLPIGEEIAHLIVTSPPYGVGIDYTRGDVLADDWPAFMAEWLHEAWRVTLPGGRLALNVPIDTTAGDYRPTYAQAVEAAIRAGWRYRSSIVWLDDHVSKSVARGSVDSASAPHVFAGAEMVALFGKGGWARSSDTPSDLGHDEWLAWTNGVWRFPGEPVAWEGHPAPFPLELPRRLIKLLSFPGDVVLDPFVGSGTTALAALQLGRQAIGFDRSQQYVESTLRRLAAHGGRPDPVHAGAVRRSVPDAGAEAGEPGGLRGRLHCGAGGAEQPVVIQAGQSGVAV